MELLNFIFENLNMLVGEVYLKRFNHLKKIRKINFCIQKVPDTLEISHLIVSNIIKNRPLYVSKFINRSRKNLTLPMSLT